MTDREILQALIDGKVIVDESSWNDLHYKLIGDRMHVEFGKHKWVPSDHIPKLDSDYVKIVEEEELKPDYEALRKTLEYIKRDLANRIDKLEEKRLEDIVGGCPVIDEKERDLVCVAFRCGFTDGIIEFIHMMESELRQEGEE